MQKYLIFFLILLLPNFFWQGVALYLDVQRVFLNIDYVLVIGGIFFRKRIVAVFLFLLVSFFDFLNIFSQIFPFIRLADLLYLIKFAVYANPVNFLFFILYLFLGGAYLYIASQKINNSFKLVILLSTNLLLVGWTIQNYFIDDSNSRIWNMQNDRYISSQMLNTYNVRTEGFIQGFSNQGDAFQNKKVDSASASIFKQPQPYKKVLLVVNESWGVSQSEIQKNLLSHLLNQNNITDSWQKTLSVNGFTLDGEIRELCQITLNHFNLKDQKVGFEHCLPNILKQQGYYTVAMHGATGAMYDRKYWYPKAGFEQTIFRESLPDLHSRCYSFPGFCDRDLQDEIVDVFTKHNKVFFYWLSLNTHVNYDLRDLVDNSFDCKQFNVDEKSSGCRNLKLQKQFFNQFSKLIQEPALKGTYVIVVGDHTPPIYDESRHIFKDGQVSMIGFYIK